MHRQFSFGLVICGKSMYVDCVFSVYLTGGGFGNAANNSLDAFHPNFQFHIDCSTCTARSPLSRTTFYRVHNNGRRLSAAGPRTFHKNGDLWRQ